MVCSRCVRSVDESPRDADGTVKEANVFALPFRSDPLAGGGDEDSCEGELWPCIMLRGLLGPVPPSTNCGPSAGGQKGVDEGGSSAAGMGCLWTAAMS